MGLQQDTHIEEGRHVRFWAASLALVLAVGLACSRQSGVLPLAPPAGASHDLPFNRSAEESGLSPTQALASFAAPIGTPIIVRLTSPLSSAEARSGDTFEAVLDEPILGQGQILVERGAPVRGKVSAAKPLEPPNHAGYLRLTIASITTNRNTFQVHASSVFAKGLWRGLGGASMTQGGVPSSSQNVLLRANQVADANPSYDGEAKISTAQRLTFRLLGPLATGH